MIEVLKQMLEALEWCHGGEPVGTASAIQAGKKLIAELESQEPVAFYNPQQGGFYWAKPTTISCPQTVDVTPLALYTHPPRRTEQNFCPRCGKRTNDIHTCTPPMEKNNA